MADNRPAVRWDLLAAAVAAVGIAMIVFAAVSGHHRIYVTGGLMLALAVVCAMASRRR